MREIAIHGDGALGSLPGRIPDRTYCPVGYHNSEEFK